MSSASKFSLRPLQPHALAPVPFNSMVWAPAPTVPMKYTVAESHVELGVYVSALKTDSHAMASNGRSVILLLGQFTGLVSQQAEGLSRFSLVYCTFTCPSRCCRQTVSGQGGPSLVESYFLGRRRSPSL